MSHGREVVVIGHRGAAGYAPENTLASFAKAVGMGVGMVELDVHLSGDGRLVLMHDATLDRTTNGSGHVWRHGTRELTVLDAGSWFSPDYRGESVPVLEDVFGALPDGVGVNVEVKAPGDGDRRSSLDLAGALHGLPALLDTCLLSAVHPHHMLVTADLTAECHARGVAVNAWTVNDPVRMSDLVRMGVDGLITDVPDVTCRVASWGA